MLLSLMSDSHLDDATEYRAVVGSLQYLSLTRPNIFFAVNKLSQFMHQPMQIELGTKMITHLIP